MAIEEDWAGVFSTCVMCGHVLNDPAISDRRFGRTPSLVESRR